jgi:cell division septation protein DedD
MPHSFTQYPHLTKVHLVSMVALLLLVCIVIPTLAGNWRVQVTAVHDLALAEQVEEQLQRAGYERVGVHWRESIYKVWVGAEETREAGSELQQRLVLQGFEDAFVVQQGPELTNDSPVPPAVAEVKHLVQVFSLSNRDDAEAAAEIAQKKTGYDATVVSGNGVYRVQLGPFESRDAAEFARQVISGRGYVDAFLVPFEE